MKILFLKAIANQAGYYLSGNPPRWHKWGDGKPAPKDAHAVVSHASHAAAVKQLAEKQHADPHADPEKMVAEVRALGDEIAAKKNAAARLKDVRSKCLAGRVPQRNEIEWALKAPKDARVAMVLDVLSNGDAVAKARIGEFLVAIPGASSGGSGASSQYIAGLRDGAPVSAAQVEAFRALPEAEQVSALRELVDAVGYGEAAKRHNAALKPPKPAKPKGATFAQRRKVDPSQDDILTAVAKLGGISLAELSGTAMSDYTRPAWGILKPFHNGLDVMTMADAVERLDELGYPVRDEAGHYSENVLADVLDRATRGERIVAESGAESEVERLAANRDADLEAQQAEDWDALDQYAEEQAWASLTDRAARAWLRGSHIMGEAAFDAFEAALSEALDTLDGAQYLDALESALDAKVNEQLSAIEEYYRAQKNDGRRQEGDSGGQGEPGGFTLAAEGQDAGETSAGVAAEAPRRRKPVVTAS